jgi:hypothetical protein
MIAKRPHDPASEEAPEVNMPFLATVRALPSVGSRNTRTVNRPSRPTTVHAELPYTSPLAPQGPKLSTGQSAKTTPACRRAETA